MLARSPPGRPHPADSRSLSRPRLRPAERRRSGRPARASSDSARRSQAGRPSAVGGPDRRAQPDACRRSCGPGPSLAGLTQTLAPSLWIVDDPIEKPDRALHADAPRRETASPRSSSEPPDCRIPLQLVDPRLHRLVAGLFAQFDLLDDRELLSPNRAGVQAEQEMAFAGGRAAPASACPGCPPAASTALRAAHRSLPRARPYHPR